MAKKKKKKSKTTRKLTFLFFILIASRYLYPILIRFEFDLSSKK